MPGFSSTKIWILSSIEIYELSSTEIFILPPSEINILLPICLKENVFSDDFFYTECMCPKLISGVCAGLDCFSPILCPRKNYLVRFNLDPKPEHKYTYISKITQLACYGKNWTDKKKIQKNKIITKTAFRLQVIHARPEAFQPIYIVHDKNWNWCWWTSC